MFPWYYMHDDDIYTRFKSLATSSCDSRRERVNIKCDIVLYLHLYMYIFKKNNQGKKLIRRNS